MFIQTEERKTGENEDSEQISQTLFQLRRRGGTSRLFVASALVAHKNLHRNGRYG